MLYQLFLAICFLSGSLVHGSENLNEDQKISFNSDNILKISSIRSSNFLEKDVKLNLNEKGFTRFQDLPNEIIIHTLKFLPLDTIGRVEQISSHFQMILQHPDIWQWNLKQIGIRNVENPKLTCVKNRDDIDLRYAASMSNVIINNLYNEYNIVLAQRQEYRSISNITFKNLQQVQAATNIGRVSNEIYNQFFNNYWAFNQQCLDLEQRVIGVRRKLKIAAGIMVIQ